MKQCKITTKNVNYYNRYISSTIYGTWISPEKKYTTIILKLLVSTLTTEPTIPTMIYSHIYPSTYKARVQMILPDHVLVHIRDDNNDQVR